MAYQGKTARQGHIQPHRAAMVQAPGYTWSHEHQHSLGCRGLRIAFDRTAAHAPVIRLLPQIGDQAHRHESTLHGVMHKGLIPRAEDVVSGEYRPNRVSLPT